MREFEESAGNAAATKEKIRARYKGINPDELEVIPALPKENIFEENKMRRVAVYARVSTGDPRQTSSYELQKNHYLDVVNRNPSWSLVDIYADEGISGTSLMHREQFKRMIADCKRNRIDLIVTKSVSRFARNVMDCIGYVRELKALNPPIGVFFETEGIFTLDGRSDMQLAFMATTAQEESHNKSEIMNASIEMRFRRGIFLTPKLLGYDLDNGKMYLNTACINKLPSVDYVLPLVSSKEKRIAFKPATEDVKDSFMWCTYARKDNKRRPKQVTCKVFFHKIFDIMDWNRDYRYKILGKMIKSNGEYLFIFDLNNAEVYQRIYKDGGKPITSRTPVFPAEWQNQFGLPYEEHKKSLQVNIFNGYTVFGLKNGDKRVSDTTSEQVENTKPEQQPIPINENNDFGYTGGVYGGF